MSNEKICTVAGCGRPLHPCGRGYRRGKYCTTHHVRVTKYGDAYEDVPIVKSGPDHTKTLAQRRAELQRQDA